MESFVQFMAPVAIALFGFVLLWGIVWIVSHRKDTGGDDKDRPLENMRPDR